MNTTGQTKPYEVLCHHTYFGVILSFFDIFESMKCFPRLSSWHMDWFNDKENASIMKKLVQQFYGSLFEKAPLLDLTLQCNKHRPTIKMIRHLFTVSEISDDYLVSLENAEVVLYWNYRLQIRNNLRRFHSWTKKNEITALLESVQITDLFEIYIFGSISTNLLSDGEGFLQIDLNSNSDFYACVYDYLMTGMSKVKVEAHLKRTNLPLLTARALFTLTYKLVLNSSTSRVIEFDEFQRCLKSFKTNNDLFNRYNRVMRALANLLLLHDNTSRIVENLDISITDLIHTQDIVIMLGSYELQYAITQLKDLYLQFY